VPRSERPSQRRPSTLLRLCVGLLLTPHVAGAQADPASTVLDQWMLHTDAENSLYRHVLHLAERQLDQREDGLRLLATEGHWLDRQSFVRRTLREISGRFPERTPLEARITGTIRGDGFTVEKLIFESLPGYHVTAAVFVPDGIESPRPAVVYASGHSADGFRSATYQTAIMNLAKKGFVVLAFDPIGQGERRQYDDPETGATRVGGPTREHSYPGAQIFTTGDSPALYFIWDGIRAIDYLQTRPDVDASRIGVTGRSGGGTQSSYIAAFDERVLAVAPENYLTSFRRLFQTRGPQDAEQNFFNGIERGIDHGDLILAHAPKPYLLIATTRDMFSIQGVRETAREVGPTYAALGGPGAFRVVEDDAEHASTLANREAMYAFFQEALDLPGDPAEVEVAPLAPADLFATPTGQVASSLGGEDLFTLNRERAGALVERLEAERAGAGHLDEVRRAAVELSGLEVPRDSVEAVFHGRFPRDGYSVEQYTIDGEGDYPIPMILMRPDGDGPHPAVLYVHGEGKAADAGPGDAMEQLVRAGFVVLAPDLVGTGEVGPGDFRGDAYDFELGIGAYNVWWGANQVGRSLVGIRAGDLLRSLQFLRSLADVRANGISAVGVGTAGPVMLHAAAVEATLTGVALVGSPLDYASLALNRYYLPRLVHAVVPGALRAYDLPDLAAAVAPRPLLIVDPVDHLGRPASRESAERAYGVAADAFGALGAASSLSIEMNDDSEDADAGLVEWLSGIAGFQRR
jgi:cephalosporin-C deacetylase-like acetyl esterase